MRCILPFGVPAASSFALGVGHALMAECRVSFDPRCPPLSNSARGVGHDEDSFAAVEGANVGSGPYPPSSAIPHFGQVLEDSPEEVAALGGEESGDVLGNNPLWRELSDDTGKLRPEITLVTRRSTLACNAVRLAREPTGDESNAAGRPRLLLFPSGLMCRTVPVLVRYRLPPVNGLPSFAHGVGNKPHVVEDGDSRPVLSQDGLAVGVSLHKGNCPESGPFGCKVKSSNAAEK